MGSQINQSMNYIKEHMFMETVDKRFRSFVNKINEYLTGNGCKCNIKLQKSGYVVSYVLNSSKKTLATFVSRKTGMKLRIYPEQIQEYQSFLDTLPEKVKKEIKKTSFCKRLINPDDCNPKCIMGYTFVFDGEQYQKCRQKNVVDARVLQTDPCPFPSIMPITFNYHLTLRNKRRYFMSHELFISLSKKDYINTKFNEVDRDTYYRLKYDTIIGSDYPGKVLMERVDYNLPLAYKEDPISADQITLKITSVVDQFLDYRNPLDDIVFYMYNMETALESNDPDEAEDWNEKLKNNSVVKFLEKVCTLDKFSIFLFQEDMLVKQRIPFTKDKSILELILWVLDYNAPQNIEIFSR